MHLVYSTTILSLFVICFLFILKPNTAQSINTFVFGDNSKNHDALDLLLLAEKDIDLSNFPANIRTVSNEMNSSLPFIEEDKSYLLYKFRNHENKTLIYVSEVRKPQQPRKLH
jgi:hypothetical protein